MAPTIDAANNAIAISVFTFGFSFFWLMFWTHQEHKKTADLHQAAESSVEIFSFGRSLSRTSTLADQGTLPSPTTGCRIRFTESLLMLTRIISQRRRAVKTSRRNTSNYISKQSRLVAKPLALISPERKTFRFCQYAA